MRVVKLFMSLCFVLMCSCQENSTEFNESRVLSRKKRFLIFPEGSSFQLVFCVTYPVITSIGDIFLWGNTAALAFELPQDPYSPFNHRADPLHRRMDGKVIYYTDEDGKIIHKQPYKRKPIVNPAFAKRSVDVNKNEIHASSSRIDFADMDTNSVEFHRDSRTDLYEKIEMMVQGLGGNGRQCLLKTLCIIGQTSHYPQGAFLQEILRAAFTLPKSKIGDYYSEYDKAHNSSGSCDEIYPDCNSMSNDNTNTIQF